MPTAPAPRPPRLLPRWLSPAWFLAGVTLVLMLYASGFFAWTTWVPVTSDINPAGYTSLRFAWPPTGSFSSAYWLGVDRYPMGLEVLSLWSWLPVWLFFTTTYAVFAALALAAAYALLRELDLGRAASGLGAVIYAWQGEVFSTILAGHFPHVVMAAIFPLAVYLVLRSARRRDFLFAALAGACTGMLVSLLQDRGMLCSLLIGSLFLVEFWQRRREGLRALAGTAVRLLLVIAVAVGIAAPGLSTITKQYIVGVETSVSPEEENTYDWATQWSYPPEELLTHLVPGFFGWRTGSAEGPYWGRVGRQPGWEESHEGFRNFALANYSLGTIGTLLVILGAVWLLRPGPPEAPGAPPARALGYGRFFLAAGLVATFMAFGRYQPLYQWWLELPLMTTWRNPLKFLMPANLAFTVVAAVAAQGLYGLLARRAETSPAREMLALFWRAAAVLLFVGWLASLVTGPAVNIVLAAQDYTPEEIARILATLRWSLFVAALVALGADLAWRQFSEPRAARGRRPENPLLARVWDWAWSPGGLGAGFLTVLGLLALAQMAWVQEQYLMLFPYTRVTDPTPFTQALRSPADPFRVTVDVTDPVLRQELGTTFQADGVQSIDVPAASRIPSDYRAWLEALQANPTRRYDLAGVRFLVGPSPRVEQMTASQVLPLDPESLKYYPLVPTGREDRPSHAAATFRHHLPKTTLVPDLEVLPDDAAVLQRLAAPDWDPRRSLLVDRARAEAAGLPPDGQHANPEQRPATLALRQYAPTRIALETDVERPAFLLINDRYSPNWQATVNGHPAPLFRADYLMRGLAIPAGRSDIVLTYAADATPVYAQLGIWAGLLVWGLVRLGRRRKA